jgi:tRNA A37 threonylcarbamoyladenosine dehydratase
VSWLASIIALERGLVTYINNLPSRVNITVASADKRDPKETSPEDLNDTHQDKVFRECEEFLQGSRRLRSTAALEAIGISKTGRIDPSVSTKRLLKKDCKEP